MPSKEDIWDSRDLKSNNRSDRGRYHQPKNKKRIERSNDWGMRKMTKYFGGTIPFLIIIYVIFNFIFDDSTEVEVKNKTVSGIYEQVKESLKDGDLESKAKEIVDEARRTISKLAKENKLETEDSKQKAREIVENARKKAAEMINEGKSDESETKNQDVTEDQYGTNDDKYGQIQDKW